MSGCLAGIAYYLGLAFVTGPILLIALQLLNAELSDADRATALPLRPYQTEVDIGR